jgi:hypothetical protein
MKWKNDQSRTILVFLTRGTSPELILLTHKEVHSYFIRSEMCLPKWHETLNSGPPMSWNMLYLEPDGLPKRHETLNSGAQCLEARFSLNETCSSPHSTASQTGADTVNYKVITCSRNCKTWNFRRHLNLYLLKIIFAIPIRPAYYVREVKLWKATFLITSGYGSRPRFANLPLPLHQLFTSP